MTSVYKVLGGAGNTKIIQVLSAEFQTIVLESCTVFQLIKFNNSDTKNNLRIPAEPSYPI